MGPIVRDDVPMRTGLVTGKEQFELREVDEPTPGPGEALVEISLCGICGSDVHAYAEGWPYAPGICGHEWVGNIVATDADVRVVDVGDRVTGGLAPGCGRCPNAGGSAGLWLTRAVYIGDKAPVRAARTVHGGKRRSVGSCPDSSPTTDAAVMRPASVACTSASQPLRAATGRASSARPDRLLVAHVLACGRREQ